MKTVVYGATRNIYRNVIPCVRSCIENGNVDRIVILCEDKRFPYDFGSMVETVDVSGQTWFDWNAPSVQTRWTYMCLMKCALTELFPELDRVVFLDCDTIVLHDLSDLFTMDMYDNYYAMVRQNNDGRHGKFTKGEYFNTGVLVCNLSLLRDGKEAELRESLNKDSWRYPEQDCINKLCKGRIMSLGGRWNYTIFNVDDHAIYIRHFAANPTWRNEEYLGQKYDDSSIR